MPIAFFLLMFLGSKLYGQVEYSSRQKLHGLYLAFNAIPSQSLIEGDAPSSIPGLVSTKKNSFSGSIEIGYSFGNFFGLSTGIGFNSLKTMFHLGAYESSNMLTDSENEEYLLKVSGSNINEELHIGSISIPLSLNFHIPLGRIVEISLQSGLNINFPVIEDCTNNGVFSYKGFYPKYNVLLENLPDYKFVNDVYNYAKGNLELSPHFVGSISSAGLDFNLKNNTQLAFAFSYFRTLTSITSNPDNGNFQLSTEPQKTNSFINEYNSVSAQSMGIMFTVRHFFGPSE